MKKILIVVLMISVFVLSGCVREILEIDCNEFPNHETCQQTDIEEPIKEENCEDNPSLDKCKEVEVDCDVDKDDPSCIEEVVIDTCETTGDLECNFILAIAESDGSFSTVNTYKLLSEAQTILQESTEDNSVIIGLDDTVLSMKYGAVNFKTKSVYETTQLGHVGFRYPTYLNGNYNIDGLYLNSEGLVIEGMIAGVQFVVNTSEIELIPYVHAQNGFSYYEVVDEELIHKIAYDIRNATFQSIGTIDIAPDYLSENTKYYSYDNHYFYTDIKVMTDDLNNATYDNAVNSENAYYNYYQYVSF